MAASDTDATRTVAFDLFREDRLPLPGEAAKRRDPIDRTYSGTHAEPRNQIRVRLDHNDIDGRWMFTVAIAGRGTIIPRQPAMLLYPYQFRDRELFMFIDPFGNAEHVTAHNLGDPVFLTVLPGPESPGFAEWYAERSTNDQPTDDEPTDPLDQLLF